MRGKSRLFALALAGLLLPFLTTPVSAGTTWTEFEGWSIVQECPWCAPGRMWVSEDWVLHIRGMQEYYYNSFTDPRIAGYEVVTVNVNMQLPEVYGPMWCTTRLDNDDGYWEATAVGYRTAEGGSYIRAIYHGHGAYEGLQARVDMSRDNPADPFWVEGVIVDPGGD